jgi:hypothetical protein
VSTYVEDIFKTYVGVCLRADFVTIKANLGRMIGRVTTAVHLSAIKEKYELTCLLSPLLWLY